MPSQRILTQKIPAHIQNLFGAGQRKVIGGGYAGSMKETLSNIMSDLLLDALEVTVDAIYRLGIFLAERREARAQASQRRGSA